MDKIEYRVRPVTRYIVTRYEESERCAGVEGKGEFDREDVAYEVAYALCKDEHDRLGYPPGDERIQYPENPAQGARATGPTSAHVRTWTGDAPHDVILVNDATP